MLLPIPPSALQKKLQEIPCIVPFLYVCCLQQMNTPVVCNNTFGNSVLMNASKSLLGSVTLGTLQTMTRDEVRLLAKRIGIKVGKNRSDTINNLLLAQSVGVMHAKVKVEFCQRPENPDDYRTPVFGKKFSNGKPSKVFRTIV